MKKLFSCVLCIFLLCVVACKFGSDKKEPEPSLVRVTFYNDSSYKVVLYKNVNPSPYDTSIAPLVELSSNEGKTLAMLPSTEKSFGDTFYIRYFARLPGSEYAEKPVYVMARPRMHNIRFVVEEDVTKTIQQPEKDALVFLQGIVKVENTGTRPIDVLKSTVYPENLGKVSQGVSLAPGEIGFYEIEFSDIHTLLNEPTVEEQISDLKFKCIENSKTVLVPEFTLQQGFVYSFKWDGVSEEIAAPVSSPIAY